MKRKIKVTEGQKRITKEEILTMEKGTLIVVHLWNENHKFTVSHYGKEWAEHVTKNFNEEDVSTKSINNLWWFETR